MRYQYQISSDVDSRHLSGSPAYGQERNDIKKSRGGRQGFVPAGWAPVHICASSALDQAKDTCGTLAFPGHFAVINAYSFYTERWLTCLFVFEFLAYF